MSTASRVLLGVLCAWALATLVGVVQVHESARVSAVVLPAADARAWALDLLERARDHRPDPPDPPPASARSYRGTGPIFVLAWSHGRVVARFEGTSSLVASIRQAASRIAADDALHAAQVQLSVTITGERRPVWWRVPGLSLLELVPLRDALVLELAGKQATALPDELLVDGAYERGWQTPIPDLAFGTQLMPLIDRLARELGTDVDDALSRGEIVARPAATFARDTYPRDEPNTADELERAARDGASFLLRHQYADGGFTYVYDAARDRPKDAGYSLPRHAGSAYFLAQIDRLLGMPDARLGARKALAWVRMNALKSCGAAPAACVTQGDRAELGSTALTALAASEVLLHGDDPDVRALLVRLTAFLRAQQRPDGEMMHEYDLAAHKPVDVQYLYYSGEAAFALLRAHEALHDPRDLAAARKLLTHLTGAGWSFFGSRYYYGEEHWTCIAAQASHGRVDTTASLDFCGRWAEYNRSMQLRGDETPWASDGTYGIGPLIVPRLTPVASRTEAFLSTYMLGRAHGRDDRALRQQIERGLAALLRHQWRPGPTRFFAAPERARGGVPGSTLELVSRDDYVQHACSAMARYARFLRDEQAAH